MAFGATSLMPNVPEGSWDPLSIPICMVSSSAGRDLMDALAANDALAVSWEMFARYDHTLEILPPHREAKLSLLSPFELKFDYPASQASFNPPSIASQTAKLALLKWTDDCVHTRAELSGRVSLPDLCRACWANSEGPLAVANGALAAGPFVGLLDSFSICFRCFHEIATLVQQTGAIGAVLGLAHNYLPLCSRHTSYRHVSLSLRLRQHRMPCITGAKFCEAVRRTSSFVCQALT